MRPPSPAPYLRLLRAESARFAALLLAACEGFGESAAPESTHLHVSAVRVDAKLSPKTLAKLTRVVGEKRAKAMAEAEAARTRIRRKLAEVPTGSGLALPSVRDTAIRVAGSNLREFRRVFKLDRTGSVVNVPIRSVAGVGAEIDHFVDRSVGLVTRMNETALEKLRAALEEGWNTGARVEQLRDSIAERLEVSTSRAELIARDQTLKLHAEITRTRQTNAGVREYIWSTSSDERVRPMHADLDGTTQSWGAPPVTNEDGDTNHPGGDYQCRCVAFPVLDSVGGSGDESGDSEEST